LDRGVGKPLEGWWVVFYYSAFQYPSWIVGLENFCNNRPADVATDLHSLQIAVLMPLNDIAQAVNTMLPLYEPIIAAIFNHRNGRTSAHYQTFGDIVYTLGPIDWAGGTLMYGYVFTIQEVKLQNVI